MNSILHEIVTRKRIEIAEEASLTPLSEMRLRAQDTAPSRNFLAAIAQPGISLIAEVKKASPSKGLIREDFNPPEIGIAYEQGGASCLSVLTDRHFFQGHLDFLIAVKSAVSLPILRKDFILEEFQVYQARAFGADAVLLIAECLDADQLKRLHDLIFELGMTPLVELYDANNVDKVLKCQPKLVGINNRDLNTFEVDLDHTLDLRKEIPDEILVVGESGIFTHQDVLKLESGGVDAILVGESLMRNEDVELATRRLLGNT